MTENKPDTARNVLPAELFVPDPHPPQQSLNAKAAQAFWGDVWRRFRGNLPAMLSLSVIAVLALFAVLAPMFSPYSIAQTDLFSTYKPPSAAHYFGTDGLGRDIWTQVWMGARVSLTVGFTAALIQMLLGVVIGCISGLYGGKVDMLIMRTVDIMIAIPFLIWVSLVVIVLEPGIVSIILAFALTQWTEIARLVRGEVLKLQKTEFVIASKAMGASSLRLIIRHFFPNILPIVIVAVTFQVTNAIFGEAFLSYIGLGIQEPLTSWGKLVAAGVRDMRGNPNLLIFPAVAISLTMLALQLIGDGLRDATDPKLRQ